MAKGKMLDIDSDYTEWGVRSALDYLLRAESTKKDSKMMDLVRQLIVKREEDIKGVKELSVKTSDDYSKLDKKQKGKFIAK